MKVAQGKIPCDWMQRSIRLFAIVSICFTLYPSMIAQTPIQAVVADDDGQASSQPAGATLEGNVADAKGGLIGKATIIVRNDATGRTRTATADALGHFSLAGLPIGTYTVDASAPGFATTVQKGVQIAADHAPTLSLTLAIGATSADITVEADRPAPSPPRSRPWTHCSPRPPPAPRSPAP